MVYSRHCFKRRMYDLLKGKKKSESQNFLYPFQQNLSLSIKLGFNNTDLG